MTVMYLLDDYVYVLAACVKKCKSSGVTITIRRSSISIAYVVCVYVFACMCKEPLQPRCFDSVARGHGILTYVYFSHIYT
jgi:hypothetical protein